MERTMTAEQIAEIHRLKSYYPYRICGAALNHETGEFQLLTGTTRARFNALSRKGWLVVVAE